MIKTTTDGRCVVVTVPMVFKIQSGVKLAIKSSGAEGLSYAQVASHPILRAFARARALMGMLDRGEVDNLLSLSERMQYDRSDLDKLLRLATLSPRIIQAVMHGTAPDQISAAKLKAIKSLDWEEQEREIGLNLPALTLRERAS